MKDKDIKRFRILYLALYFLFLYVIQIKQPNKTIQ